MRLLPAFLLLLPLASMSQQPEPRDLWDRVVACQQIESPGYRLECFDELPELGDFPESEPRMTAPPSGQRAEPRVEPQITQDQPVRGGKPAQRDENVRTEQQSANEPAQRPVDQFADEFPMRSEVVKIDRPRDNRVVFYLENGTIWRENEASGYRFRAGGMATITRKSVLFSNLFTKHQMELDGYEFVVQRVK